MFVCWRSTTWCRPEKCAPCVELRADHPRLNAALNSLPSFIPPAPYFKLSSRSLSKLQFFTMKGSNMKKTILRSFFRGHPFSLHAKFQVSYSTPSRFVKKMTYFCIIFVEKYFFAKYLRFYTSTKNFIKIRPKMSKRQPIKKKLFFTYCPS